MQTTLPVTITGEIVDILPDRADDEPNTRYVVLAVDIEAIDDGPVTLSVEHPS